MENKLILTVDLDEWYHIRWCTGGPNAIYKNSEEFFNDYYKTDGPIGELETQTDRVLDIFKDHDITATFFVLGEIAQYYPELVRRIQGRGHEIACHGLYHKDYDIVGRDVFRNETIKARDILESLIRDKVVGFRAPNLIITRDMLDVLEEVGFRYDSSITPSRRFFGKYGYQNAPNNPYRPSKKNLDAVGDRNIIEIPLPSFPIIKLPVGSGIWTRILGYNWTYQGIKNALKYGPTCYYFHPYEIFPRPLEKGKVKFRLRQKIFFRNSGEYMERSLKKMINKFQNRISCIRDFLEESNYE